MVKRHVLQKKQLVRKFTLEVKVHKQSSKINDFFVPKTKIILLVI